MTGALRRLSDTADLLRSRLSHVYVERADGSGGFALFGGWAPRHRVASWYLGSEVGVRTRVLLHRSATARFCRELAARDGLVVFCGPTAPPGLERELFRMPTWVDMDMPTPTSFERHDPAWRANVRVILRRVHREGFSFDVAPSHLMKDFYTRMVRPSMASRHGVLASVEPWRVFRSLATAPGAELLRVFRHGEWVAGNLNRSTAQGYQLHRVGWRDGDLELHKKRVVGAAYWFGLQRARQLGHERVLLGGTPPLLDDGLFQYKERWGGRLMPDGRNFGDFHLLFDLSHPTAREFLRTRSLLGRGPDGAWIAVTGTSPEALGLAPELRAQIARWYRWTGEAHTPSPITDLPEGLSRWFTPCGPA